MKPSVRTQARWLCLLVLLLACAASPRTGHAQARDPNKVQPTAESNLLSMTVVRVRPEMDAAFRNLMKTKTNPALKRGGMKWRDVWQTATFGNLYEYLIVAPVENFAQYDEPSAIERALGKAGYDAWRLEAGRLVTDAHTSAAAFRSDLSYETEMKGPPKMGVVSVYHVAPGRTGNFEETLKEDYLPVIKRSGIGGYWVSQTMFGGDPNEYLTLALHENYKEIDKGPPVRRVLGAEKGEELIRKLLKDNVTHVERSVIRFIPELSFRQSPPGNR
ncbi:MAG: hypothetical protein LC754_12880 [Acidobacteria bacterium]|nr:hypothetical protein [Acidobacteriota bacterium]